MLAALTDLHDTIVDVCHQFGVLTLSVFGSAATSEFDAATSDIDLLVELDPPAGMTRFDAFFGLKEALEKMLSRPVDLVDPSALENPYFAQSVEASRRELYAA
jgi:predicted nucleotidyltransferase